MYGKTLAWRERLPLIGVHHLEGHLFAPTLEHADLAPPFMALLVSGGPHHAARCPAPGATTACWARRGTTPPGEAFDKVGTLLGLDYPGGAADRAARRDG